jgi:hypothetical protein
MGYNYRPMTRAASANPYGTKVGPRTKVTLGGPIGSLIDLGVGLWDNQRYNRFQHEQLDPHNRRVNQLLGRFGEGSNVSPIDYGDQQGNYDVANADSMFGDRSIRSLASTAYRPVVNGLATLPDRIAGQTAGTLQTFGASANDINSEFRTGASSLGSRFGTLASDLAGGFGDLSGDVTGGYQERLERARGIVGGISDQETQDANRRFNEQSAGETARLVSQGLSGSTVGASVRGGVERQRGDELRRIADQTALRQLGVEDTFGGAGLQAQERIGTAGLTSRQTIGLAGLGETGANLRYGGGLASELANNLAARGIDAAQLNSTTGLEALRQRGAISQSQFDALIAARTTRLNTRTGRTDRGVAARQGVFGTSASTLGGPIYVAPGATSRA